MDVLKVLLLPLQELFHPWCDEIIAAIDPRHDLRIYNPEADLARQFAGIDVVIDHGGSVGTRAMMDAATDARLWQIVGTGFDHFDLEYIRAKGVPVANCPGQFSSIPLAETAMMYILMLARQYRAASANFHAGTLYQPMGRELVDAHLGIIGFGASGQELARRARGFGMRLLAIDIRPMAPAVLDELQPDFLGTPDDLDTVIARSDYLSLHLHLNDQTRHLINAERLALMKKDACLINVARGALADEEALYQALLAGRIGGAGLDAFAREPPDPSLPVYQLPNVVVTPHIAGVTDGTARRRAACTGQNVERIAAGLEPLYRIDR